MLQTGAGGASVPIPNQAAERVAAGPGDPVLSQKLNGSGKRVEEGQERGTLSSQSKQALDQTNLGQNVALIYSFDLPFSNHIHRLVAA